MREIKFRAWDLRNEKMHDWEQIRGHWDIDALLGGIWESFGGKEHVWNYPIPMQYIGIKDKNGVEIFEGDYIICRQYLGGNFVEYASERGYVEFKFGSFGLHRKQGFYRPFKDWLEEYEFEIIGNIYENPELLKVR